MTSCERSMFNFSKYCLKEMYEAGRGRKERERERERERSLVGYINALKAALEQTCKEQEESF